MISFKHKGGFYNLERFFKKITNQDYLDPLDRLAMDGVNALSASTPSRTGKTANSWDYEIKRAGGMTTITWKNSNINKGVNIALILQHGHGTRNGGYVVGRDYINPAIRPIFDEIADSAWKEVTSK